MNNKRKQWGLYRVKSIYEATSSNLIGTFVGLGSILYATRKEASFHMPGGCHGSFQVEVRKFNSRKDNQ